MKYDACGLLLNAALRLKGRDAGTGYALAELAKNLRLVVRGEASLDDFRKAYVVSEEPIDPDALFPVTKL